MSSKYTSKYGLNQWEKTDKVLMEEFNEDNRKIDAALAKKSDQSALDTLTSALSTTQGTIPKVIVGTYTGNGAVGASGQNSLTFTFKPKLVVLGGEKAMGHLISGQTIGMARVGQVNAYYTITWSGNTVSWYMTGGNGNGGAWVNATAEFQMNNAGVAYRYFAIG